MINNQQTDSDQSSPFKAKAQVENVLTPNKMFNTESKLEPINENLTNLEPQKQSNPILSSLLSSNFNQVELFQDNKTNILDPKQFLVKTCLQNQKSSKFKNNRIVKKILKRSKTKTIAKISPQNSLIIKRVDPSKENKEIEDTENTVGQSSSDKENQSLNSPVKKNILGLNLTPQRPMTTPGKGSSLILRINLNQNRSELITGSKNDEETHREEPFEEERKQKRVNNLIDSLSHIYSTDSDTRSHKLPKKFNNMIITQPVKRFRKTSSASSISPNVSTTNLGDDTEAVLAPKEENHARSPISEKSKLEKRSESNKRQKVEEEQRKSIDPVEETSTIQRRSMTRNAVKTESLNITVNQETNQEAQTTPVDISAKDTRLSRRTRHETPKKIETTVQETPTKEPKSNKQTTETPLK